MITYVKKVFTLLNSKATLIFLMISASLIGWQWYEKTQAESKFTKIESELSVLKNNHDVLKNQYDVLAKQIDQKKQSDEITEGIQVDAAKDSQNAKNTLQEINRLVEERVRAIRKKYEALEASDTNRKAKEREVSEARITGLWETYCAGTVNQPSCKKMSK